MGKAARVTLTLPEEMLEAADQARASGRRSRSELMREALGWYLRVSSLAVEEPTAAERRGITVGRAEHARGERLSHADIRRDLEARVREAGG